MRLRNKTAIVTGAGSGLGRAATERFAEEGATVVAADIDGGSATETADRIEANGGEALARELDVTDADAVEATVDETVETLGLDVVVLAVPPYHIGDTVADLAAQEAVTKQLLVSPAVGMQGDETGLHYHPPSVGSVTELVAERAPTEAAVAGAFHNLSAGRLADLDAFLDIDTLVVADEEAVREKVVNLTNELDGIRALGAGPLANAAKSRA